MCLSHCLCTPKQLASQGRWLSHPTQCCCSPTSSTVCNSGCLSMPPRRTSDYGVYPEEGNQDGERSQGQGLAGTAEFTQFVQLGEEKAYHRSDLIRVYNFLIEGSRGEGAHLFSLETSDKSEIWNEAASDSFSSDWTLGKDSSLWGWLITGTASPAKWWWHQACHSSRSI